MVDIVTAVLGVAALSGFVLAFREYLQYKKAINIRQISVNGTKEKVDFNSLIDQVDTALEETMAIRAEMLSKQPAPSKEQLDPLDKRINQLVWVKDNQWWLRYVAPYADDAMKLILKMLK